MNTITKPTTLLGSHKLPLAIKMLKQEVMQTYSALALIWGLAWDDIKVRYARSVIGPFWLVLTTAICALGLGYIWSILLHQDKVTFIPALCTGLVIWQFLATCILEAPQVFVDNAPILKNTCNSILIFPLVVISKNLIVFAHNLIIVLVAFLIYPPEINMNILLIVPGFFLVIANLIWAIFVVGILGARYRDLAPAINSFMAILFFLSPVMYKPGQLGLKEHLLWFNPFTYLISLIRDPLTGHASPLFAYVVMVISLFVGCAMMIYLLGRYRYRVLYWL